MARLLLRLVRFFSVVALAAVGCLAQYSGNIQGMITDPTGAAISGGSVRLLNQDIAVTVTATTSSTGNYRFNSLQPGRYTVTAEAAGFQTTAVNLTLSTSETQGINITLPLGSASQSVTVTGEAPVLDTDESRLQATLQASTVRDSALGQSESLGHSRRHAGCRRHRHSRPRRIPGWRRR